MSIARCRCAGNSPRLYAPQPLMPASIRISGLPAFSDNYIWVGYRKPGQSCFVVDPGDPDVVLNWLEKNNHRLTDILITHHHLDHIGGIGQLKKAFPAAQVYGPATEDIQGIDRRLREGDEIIVADCRIRIHFVPGHTAGHIAYHLTDDDALFCGDTLFSGGCGRLFEGTPEQMTKAMAKFAELPSATKVYCAHEYTQSNLDFAIEVEPDNNILRDYRQRVQGLRGDSRPTIPSTIGLERDINPFMRVRLPSIINAARRQAPSLGIDLTDQKDLSEAQVLGTIPRLEGPVLSSMATHKATKAMATTAAMSTLPPLATLLLALLAAPAWSSAMPSSILTVGGGDMAGSWQQDDSYFELTEAQQHADIWSRVRSGMRFERQLHRSPVRRELDLLVQHLPSFYDMMESARPYLHHVVAEVERRKHASGNRPAALY